MNAPAAISGTRRAMRELADGTIRVMVDIEPPQRAAFLALFPEIDMPVALAPLVPDHRREPDIPPAKAQAEAGKPAPGAAAAAPADLKGGELARLAGMFCQQRAFLEFTETNSPDEAAEWVRSTCGVASRAELDHDDQAAARFHERVRKPYLDWKEIT